MGITKKQEIDMTKGNPSVLILKFMTPLIIGNIFQQFYNMADTIIVGRFVGVTALAAVGATGTVMFLILGFLMGLLQGFTVITAQRFGAGDYDGVKQSVANACILSAGITVIVTFVSVHYMDALLRIMNTSEDMFAMAKTYITVICLGTVFNMLYNLLASFLRAVGNSKAPLYFLMISALLNIFLDLFLIVVIPMGVAGAALATILSQGISGILCLIYMLRKVPVLIPRKTDWHLDAQCTYNQLMIGFPMALQFSITAIGTILVQSSLNLLGSVAVAAYTVACKVEQLFTQVFSSIGMTDATYAAQNMGVGNVKRIKKGVVLSNAYSAIYAVVIYAALFYSCPFFTRIFISGSVTGDLTLIIRYVETYIHLCGLFFIPLGMIFIFRNIMQGCGYSFWPMMGGVTELVCRAVVAVLAAKAGSFAGICWANASAWLITGVFLWICYLFVIRKIEKRFINLTPD